MESLITDNFFRERTVRRLATLTAALLLFTTTATVSAQASSAQAEMVDVQGNVVGTATLQQNGNGVSITLQVKNMPAGSHGVHLHAVGKCDGPDFMSASGHFNPGNKQHGTKNPQGHHAGDLPNLMVNASGTGSLQTMTNEVALMGGPTSLFDADGSALVIHANPDDDLTDPSGNSGGRIACGILKQMPSSLPRAGEADPNASVLVLVGIGVALISAGFFMRRRII